MTVFEAIEMLKTFPPLMEVKIQHVRGGCSQEVNPNQFQTQQVHNSQFGDH